MDISHENEAYNTFYNMSHVIDNISLPDHKDKIPRIIGWCGPARSGTTPLLYLLASQPDVDRVYFQPIKTLLRRGSPSLRVRAEDDIICMKEPFRLCCVHNYHDPIKALLDAGVPADRITWITMLRDPVKCYSSWVEHIKGVTPHGYKKVQDYTVDFYNKYRFRVNMVPFVYDLFQDREREVARVLLNKIAFPSHDVDINFNKKSIRKKFIRGQASEAGYYNTHIKPSYDRKRMIYGNHSPSVDGPTSSLINDLCRDQYDRFLLHSVKELGL